MSLPLGDLLRLAISAWILVVLVRSARNAWARRDLLVLVWRGLRPSVVARAAGLLVVVVLVATLLLELVPPLRYGLGTLVDFDGNAVFTPLEEAAGALGPPPELGPDWPLIALATGFLGFLLLLLPWLAFVEEEVFRAGTELLDRRGQALAALRFGLVHLVMLVPVGAALAIAVAGWVYGRVYRREALREELADPPAPAMRAYRPTRRAREAEVARRGLVPEGTAAAVLEHTIERRQVAGVLAAATLHTAFNSLVLLLVWTAIVVPAATR